MRTNWHSLREFEALRAVISAGTTTAAARRLGISQSAVSRSVAQLENRIGRILFEREAGRMQPTAEALALNQNLDAMFDALARIDGQDWTATKEQTLRLVAPPTIAHRFLQRHIASFRDIHPRQRIVLEICASDALVAGVAEARFDVGITDSASGHSGIKLHPLRTSTAVCIMSEGHPLSANDIIRPEHLDGQPFIALTRRHSVRGAIDRVFAESGVSPQIVLETATSVSACQFARAGVGVTLINPFPVVLSYDGGMEVRPFAPDIFYRTSFLTSAHTPVSLAARAFIRHVRFSTPRDPYSTAA